MTLRVKQLIVVVCLLGFILFVTNRDYYKNVDINNIKSAVEKSKVTEELVEFAPTDIKKDFGFNINDYGEAFYFGKESNMECDTILIIKLMDESQGTSIVSALETKKKELMKLYQSYAPDQYSMLKNCVLEQKGQYVIYIVSEKASSLKKIVLNCIKG